MNKLHIISKLSYQFSEMVKGLNLNNEDFFIQKLAFFKQQGI